MERSLLLVALVLSLVVGGLGFIPPLRRVALPWQSALPALLAALLSLPTAGLFAPGQALGLGILAGGIAGALAAWLVLQEKPIAAAAWALAPQLLLLYLKSPFPLENQLGAALGLLSALCVVGLRAPETLSALTVVGTFVVSVAAASCLGTFRTGATAKLGWVALPPLFAAGTLALSALLTLGRPKDLGVRYTLGIAAYLVMTTLALRPLALATVGASWPTLSGLWLALPVLLLLCWLNLSDKRGMGVFLVVLALSLASHNGQGYGVALLALGLALLVLLTEPVPALLPALAAVAIVALWRLLAQRFDGARGFGLHENYLLLGLLLGGVLPRLAVALSNVLSAGVILLTLPSAFVVAFGPQAGLTLVLGLLAGQLWSATSEKESTLQPLYALAVGTLLAQLLGHLGQLSAGTRLDRLLLAYGIGLGGAALAGLGSLLGRTQTGKRK